MSIQVHLKIAAELEKPHFVGDCSIGAYVRDRGQFHHAVGEAVVRELGRIRRTAVCCTSRCRHRATSS